MDIVVAAVISKMYDNPKDTVCWGLKYMVIRRGENCSFPGMICFPGGRVESSDNSRLQLAVMREMYEEMGLHVLVEGLHFEASEDSKKILPYEEPSYLFTVHFMECRISEGTRAIQCDLREVEELLWMTLDQLDKCETLIPSMRSWVDQQKILIKGESNGNA